MKTIRSELIVSLRATLVLALVTCGLYPLVVTGVSVSLFPEQAHGSLIVDKEGQIRGSTLLSQSFAAEGYFHPRPSAAGAGHDAAGSSGSNLGPTSKKLHDAIKARIAAYRASNGLAADAPVPADAVTASGSGLDPHISEPNAALQAKRVAKARGLNIADVEAIIAANTERPDVGLFGEKRVNVLKLNLALDGLK
ncbi:MAG: K(+)-transporting ATPase subunit C [Verrucomicrobiales bacterium]|nr:K(+)-transporting ATPase subunit C [Verrucomicrobiales bacterium]